MLFFSPNGRGKPPGLREKVGGNLKLTKPEILNLFSKIFVEFLGWARHLSRVLGHPCVMHCLWLGERQQHGRQSHHPHPPKETREAQNNSMQGMKLSEGAWAAVSSDFHLTE